MPKILGIDPIDADVVAESLPPATQTDPGLVDTTAQTFGGDKTFANNVIVTGDLTVNGTNTILNTSTLDVEDKNIVINKNGTDASAIGAGISVDRTGVDGSLVYDSTLTSKWKLGDAGSESEVITSAGTQTISGQKTFSGIVQTSAGHLGGFGLVPVGAVIAYNPGYYTSNANAGFTTVGPVSNTIASINSYLNTQGWYVCDGSAISVAGSPIWNAAGRYLPNLSNNRFLRGATTVGGTGGADTTSIAHTHDFTTDTASASWSSSTVNTTFTNPSVPAHYHGIGAGASLTAAGQTHSGTVTSVLREASALGNRVINKDGGTNNGTLSVFNDGLGNGTSAYYVSVNIDHTHGDSAVTGTVGTVTGGSNGNSSFSTTGGGASFNKNTMNTNQIAHSHTGTTGGASVSTVSIVPTYLNTVYIIRVR